MTYLLKRLALDAFLFLTAPLVLAFIPREWNRLPSWLRYYEDFNYGINGDESWINPALGDHPPDDAAARSWRWRVKWSWRNANTFDHENGLDTRQIVRLEYDGDPDTSNRPGHSGQIRIRCYDAAGREYACIYRVKQWGSSGRCLRLYSGYKLMDILEFWLSSADHSPEAMDRANLRPVAQRVWAWNPLMGFATA